MKKKINNYSCPEDEIPNNRSWHDFMDKESIELFSGKEEWRKKLIHTMIKWAEKPTSLEIMQFCIQYKVPYMTLREWEMKYPEIHNAYVEIKRMLACHRRIGSMNKKLDGSYAYKDMHIYDPEWHAINKYHSDLKKEEERQSHTFVIDMSRPKTVSKEEIDAEREKNE